MTGLKIALVLVVLALLFVVAMADSVAFGPGNAIAPPVVEGTRLCSWVNGVRRCIYVPEVAPRPKGSATALPRLPGSGR